MAYQIKREKQYFVEDIELLDRDGRIALSIHVALDPDSVVEKVSRKYMDLVRIQQSFRGFDAATKNDTEVQEAYARLRGAVIALLEAVFGEEDTRRLLDYFEDSYIEMVRQVGPWIKNVAVPRIREIAQKNRKQIMTSYSRQARRRKKRG